MISNSFEGEKLDKNIIQNVINEYIEEHPWPMFRHDLKNTGRSKYTGPPNPNLFWKYKVDDGIASSAAIHSDGTIYVGSGYDKFNLNDTYLYAFYPNGTLKWKFDGKHGFFSSPSITTNGTIYCVSNGDFLFSLEDAGTHAELNWKTRLEYFFGLCSPKVGNDGTIHVGSPSYYYFQLNPDGTIKWRYKTDWCIISSPAIDDYGTVYIGSKDHNLYAFGEFEQRLKWKYSTGEFYDGHLIDSSPAIGEDGTIYFGTDPYGAVGQDPIIVNTNFWAVNPNGTLKWVIETDDGVESSPAIASDGTIYFGSYDGYLYSVKDNNSHGILNWKYKTEGSIDGSPIIDGDGIIYFGSRDSYLYALYPNGTLKWKFKAEDGFESSPSIDSKGFLYIGNFDGYFYCIGTGDPDMGVESIETPSYISPGLKINPKAVIRNYRNNYQNFDVTCEIEKKDEVIYFDLKNINISGGISKEITFKTIDIDNELGVVYNLTISIPFSNDENQDNNIKIKKIITSINFAPEKPIIIGPSIGKTGFEYNYSIKTYDPNGDDVYYWISWYEDYPVKLWQGPYKSGEEVIINFTYNKAGNYKLRIKSKDIYDKESEWATLRVTMPNSIKKSLLLYFFFQFSINKY